MKVTFTKMGKTRYSVAVTRAKGSTSVPTQPVPQDAYMPRELAQFLVEEQFGIRLGVFGRLAAADAGGLRPGEQDRSGRARRAAARANDVSRADMDRSERLVALCRSLWEARAGHASGQPAVIDMTLATPFDVDRAIHRLDDVSAQWIALAQGESMTMEWPSELALSTANSARI
jgi:hypothetical protein